MNSALPIEASIRTASLGRRIRAALSRIVTREPRELTREELAQRHEHQLTAERILDEARTSVYTVRVF
jgi:hypothetical protein